jgi:membrane protein implicated in regulation of membrane protease activity
MTVVHYVILVLSGAAIVVGVLVIAGVLVPQNFPEEFRVVIGVVIVLYGLYRFVVEYIRKSNENRSRRVDTGGRRPPADGMP